MEAQTIPETASQGDLADAWQDFLAAMRESRQARRGDEGLSLAQYRLLRPLHERGSLRVGQLADEAGIRGPTATRMLDGLERAGLVRRSHSRADRRHVRVTLTPKGREAAVEKRTQIERARDQAFDALSGEEREHAARFLRLMAEAIREL